MSGEISFRGRDRSDLGDSTTMSFLVQVAEELNSTLELDAVLAKIAERVKEYVDYDSFGILLLDPLGQELEIHFGHGFPEEVVEHWRFGLGQGIVGIAAQKREPIRVDDVRSDARYINASSDTRAEMAIPLIAKGRTIGVLDVQSRRAGYYTEIHQRVLTFLAGHLANAIENARLYENLREQTRSLSLLHEVGKELTSILELDSLLSKVAALVKRITDYQLFSVMLWDEEARLLRHAFSSTEDGRFCQKTDFPLGYGLTGTSAALRQPLRVPNVHLDPRYVRCGHKVEVHSELCVPLVFKDRLIGVVDLESVNYNAFTERDEQMLSILGSYIAVAIENSRLYERVSQGEKRLAEDLATARDIQKGLLPDATPEVPGLDVAFVCEPARQLGGDFYDVLPYGEGRLAIAVGDVAGKATAAALHASLAVGVMRAHVVQHPCEPSEMLEHLNEPLVQLRLGNRYVAMAFALYEAKGRTLSVANAGFPRPHWVRDGRVEEIPVHGRPLGLLPDTRYGQQTLTLRPGDLVVFCSDGVLECANREGAEYGGEQLGRLVASLAEAPARVIADRILEATSGHLGHDGEFADDRTVVVLKVTS